MTAIINKKNRKIFTQKDPNSRYYEFKKLNNFIQLFYEGQYWNVGKIFWEITNRTVSQAIISENTMAHAVAAIDRTMHSNDLRRRTVSKADKKQSIRSSQRSKA